MNNNGLLNLSTPISTTNSNTTTQTTTFTARQEDKNRKLLEDLNRTRQMMLKNSSNRILSNEVNAMGLSTSGLTKDLNRTPVTINGMDMQTSVTFLPTNSAFGNSILPIIPRIPPD